jgi:hypothetical protein
LVPQTTDFFKAVVISILTVDAVSPHSHEREERLRYFEASVESEPESAPSQEGQELTRTSDGVPKGTV